MISFICVGMDFVLSAIFICKSHELSPSCHQAVCHANVKLPAATTNNCASTKAFHNVFVVSKQAYYLFQNIII